jgi:hypothetical protein
MRTGNGLGPALGLRAGPRAFSVSQTHCEKKEQARPFCRRTGLSALETNQDIVSILAFRAEMAAR